MIVCSCYGVSDRTLRKLVEEGADTPQEIEAACGAGGDCGSCKRHIAELLEAEAPEPRCWPLPILQTG